MSKKKLTKEEQIAEDNEIFSGTTFGPTEEELDRWERSRRDQRKFLSVLNNPSQLYWDIL